MRIMIFLIILSTSGFSVLLKCLTYHNRKKPLPLSVSDVYNDKEYNENKNYIIENVRYDIVEEITQLAFVIMLLATTFHFRLYEWIKGYTINIYILSIIVLVIPDFASSVINMFVGIYKTFHIERKYGFNKTTPGTYIFDWIRESMIGIVITSGMLALFILMHQWMDVWVYIAFFFVLVMGSLIFVLLSPYLLKWQYKQELCPSPAEAKQFQSE